MLAKVSLRHLFGTFQNKLLVAFLFAVAPIEKHPRLAAIDLSAFTK